VSAHIKEHHVTRFSGLDALDTRQANRLCREIRLCDHNTASHPMPWGVRWSGPRIGAWTWRLWSIKGKTIL